jgi:hypothetical protein
LLTAEEVLLVGGFFVTVAGRDGHAFDAEAHEVVEEGADAGWVRAFEERGVRGDAEAELFSGFDGLHGDLKGPFAADGAVVLFAGAIEMYGEGEIFRGAKAGERFFKLEGVGAEVDEAFAFHQAGDDFIDFRMQERLAAGNGNDGSAAFIGGGPALLGSELLAEDVSGELDFATAGTGEVAAEEWLEHEDQRISLNSAQPLAEDVGGDGVGLGEGGHGEVGVFSFRFSVFSGGGEGNAGIFISEP